MRVSITTENDPEPQGFKDVAPPTFQNGFLVLEGPWDTYLVRSDLIREIRVIEEENQMPLNYAAAEYKAAVQAAKDAADNTERDALRDAVITAINNLNEYVVAVDNPELIERANEKLRELDFELIRVSDNTGDGNCKYKINTLV